MTSEPVCAFSGHTSPVTAVRFMQRDRLVSYSKDEVCVCVLRQLSVTVSIRADVSQHQDHVSLNPPSL